MMKKIYSINIQAIEILCHLIQKAIKRNRGIVSKLILTKMSLIMGVKIM
jgi:hypothetical protein